MVPKFKNKLEQRQINTKTGSTWAIQDVPAIWYEATKEAVEADHYTWAEDGTAIPIPVNE